MKIAKEFQGLGPVQAESDITVASLCAILARNRQDLIEFIKSNLVEKSSSHFLEVVMEGIPNHDKYFFIFETEADIPYKSVPCPCGNPKHWLIKYEEEIER